MKAKTKTIPLTKAYEQSLARTIDIIAVNESSDSHKYSLISVKGGAKHIADVTAVAWKHGKKKKDPQALIHAALIRHGFNLMPEMFDALDKMTRHYDDLCKSNPGWMGKMCLQDYKLWNEALLAMQNALAKAKDVSIA